MASIFILRQHIAKVCNRIDRHHHQRINIAIQMFLNTCHQTFVGKAVKALQRHYLGLPVNCAFFQVKRARQQSPGNLKSVT